MASFFAKVKKTTDQALFNARWRWVFLLWVVGFEAFFLF